ncbi:MAG TPA: anthranilate synthase component I [Gemmatimonadales bacterium]|nr:anthranilate synthase component I [Gemmatimonadales bacterium]
MLSLEQFRTLACPGAVVPLVAELVLDTVTPVAAFARLHRGGFGFLLESLEGGERWARYTFLATEPSEAWRYRGSKVERWTPLVGWQSQPGDVAPLDHLAGIMRQAVPAVVPGLPRFTGGAVGFLGYDIVRSLEQLGSGPPDDRDIPDAVVMIADTVVAFDNLHHRALIIANVRVAEDHDLDTAYDNAVQHIADWTERLNTPTELPHLSLSHSAEAKPPATPAASAAPQVPAESWFVDHVAQLKDHIRAGDIFQAVLSRRFEVPAPDPLLAYRYLRALNPAPYLFLLQLDDFHLVGSSPEVLVRVEDDVVTVRPIAGTRPRGATEAEDLALEQELLADPKERAEHLMLVDLGRNDVGHVSAYGTVDVPVFMTIERYSHVMHIVSEVRGKLAEGRTALDALAAAFPAGTVSGAPKVRAMQLIDEMEPVRRGPYAGAIGYIGWGGKNLDTAIAIRTAVIKGGKAWVQAGAGIVADSVPENELKETEAKARAVLIALQLASG